MISQRRLAIVEYAHHIPFYFNHLVVHMCACIGFIYFQILHSSYLVYLCILQINEFVKRAKAAKIHAYITSHLKKEMPAMMGKVKTQERLINNLEDEFGKVCVRVSRSVSVSLSLSHIVHANL